MSVYGALGVLACIAAACVAVLAFVIGSLGDDGYWPTGENGMRRMR